jgi:hypothetical protein
MGRRRNEEVQMASAEAQAEMMAELRALGEPTFEEEGKWVSYTLKQGESADWVKGLSVTRATQHDPEDYELMFVEVGMHVADNLGPTVDVRDAIV